MTDWMFYFREYRNHAWSHGPCSFLEIVYFIKSGLIIKDSIIMNEYGNFEARAGDVDDLKVFFNCKENRLGGSSSFVLEKRLEYEEILVPRVTFLDNLRDVLVSIFDFIFYYTPFWYLRFFNLFGWERVCPKCRSFSFRFVETIYKFNNQVVRSSYNWDLKRYEQVFFDVWLDRHFYKCVECGHKSCRDIWRSQKA